MLFLELGLQGVRGFPPVTRLALKPGLNVGKTPIAEARRTLAEALFHVLYPEAGGVDVTRSLIEPSEQQHRLALTYQGRDGRTYRLMRDLQTGGSGLHKYDSDKRTFNKLVETAAEVGQYLRGQEGLPDEQTYRRLFLIHKDLRSARPSAAGSRVPGKLVDPSAAGPSAPGLPQRFLSTARPGLADSRSAGGSGVTRPLAPRGLSSSFGDYSDAGVEDEPVDPEEERQQKLKELRVQLDNAKTSLEIVLKAEAARAELDRLNERKIELLDVAEKLEKLEEELKPLREAAEGDAAELGHLPDDMAARLRAVEDAADKRDLDLKRVDEDIRLAKQGVENARPTPLYKDRYFIAGVAVMVGAILGAVSLERPWLALVNVLGAMIAVGSGLRYVQEMQREAKAQERLDAYLEKRAKVEEQFELETGVVKRLMDGVINIMNLRVLLQKVENWEQRKQAIAEREAQLAELTRDPEKRQAVETIRRIDAKMTKLEVEVAEVEGTLGTGTTSTPLRKRIKTIEKQLAELGEPAPSEDGSEAETAVPSKGGADPAETQTAPEVTGPDFTDPMFDESGAGESTTGDPEDEPDVASFEDDGDEGYGSGYSCAGARYRRAGGEEGMYAAASGSGGDGGSDDSAPTKLPSFHPPSAAKQPPKPAAPRTASGSAARAAPPAPAAPAAPAPRSASASSSAARAAPAQKPGIKPIETPAVSLKPLEAAPPKPEREPGVTVKGLDAPVVSGKPLENSKSKPRSAADPGDSSSARPLQKPLESSSGRPLQKPAATATGKPLASRGASGSQLGPRGATPAVPGRPGSAMGRAPSGPGLSPISSAPDVEEPEEPGDPSDVTVQAMRAGAEIFSLKPEQLAQALLPRLEQYIGGLSGGRLPKVRLGPGGAVLASQSADTDGLPHASLPGPAADLVETATILCIVEASFTRLKMKVPILLDDPFPSMDAERRELFGKMLTHLATYSQVLVLTGKDDLTGNQVSW